MLEQHREFTKAGSREAIADSWEYCYWQPVVIEQPHEDTHDCQQQGLPLQAGHRQSV